MDSAKRRSAWLFTLAFAAGVWPVAGPPLLLAAAPQAPGLQSMLDHAAPGATIRIPPGLYPGPLVLRRGVKLLGPRTAVIRSNGLGSTVRIFGKNCGLEGVTVDGSGGRYDTQDAGVYIRADSARVVDVAIRHSLFGIWADSSKNLVLEGNQISGNKTLPLGLRGDGIHLWEVRGSLIQDNTVEDSRDVVVWYSSNNRLARNRVVGGRYGTHFMYSDGNRVSDSAYVNDVVGIFSMYSRNLLIQGNRFKGCTGGTGFGFGAKESGNLTLIANSFVDDTVGVHLDNSPFEPGDSDRFTDNLFGACDTAVYFNGVASGSRFHNNSFQGNGSPFRMDGNSNALRTQWDGNYFDDYQGYDLDGDGVGDVAYESRDLVDDLARTHPALDFFKGTPGLAMLCVAGHVLPLYEPALLMTDRRPSMHPRAVGAGLEN